MQHTFEGILKMTTETHVINLGFVNAFLINTGDSYILIDTGVAQQWARLEKELLEAGCLPNHLKLVIITHGDFDHTGNCAELKQKYKAKIAMHPADLEMARKGLRATRHGKGLVSNLLLKLTEHMGGDFRTFEPDILLEDGQRLDEYGFAAKILHTPGHTKGSISILTDSGELFCGDTFGNYTKPASAPFIENDRELQNSIAILKGTNARIVYSGHGRPFPFEAISSTS
jgi:glyoxylase-like metal-dependent hydrolase (beta-lactamase superfamily II)